MCEHSFGGGATGSAGLTVALDARTVINTLIGYFDGEEISNSTKKGIAIINDARTILRYLNGLDKSEEFKYPRTEYFSNYDERILVKTQVEKLNWKTWDEDLDQWLLNKEQVLEFFKRLEMAGTSQYRHSKGGCF